MHINIGKLRYISSKGSSRGCDRCGGGGGNG